MNKIIKGMIAASFIAATVQAKSEYGKSFFAGRSQGHNLGRWMAGQGNHLHLCNTDYMNGSLSATAQYGATFNAKEAGRWFFFNGTDTMTFGGTGSATTPDVFSRNFMLNDDSFNSTIQARPKKEDALFDFNFFVAFDEWVPGLYFRLDVPFVWTRWKMNLKETIANSGTEIAANKIGTTKSASPFTSVVEAWKGGKKGSGTGSSLVASELTYAKIDDTTKKNESGVADVTMVLGYDIISNDKAHFGFNGRLVVPTGTRPDAEYVFAPVLGNGHHLEVGAGVTGSYEFWNDGCDQAFSVFADANLYHMFGDQQNRTFDLTKSGVGSRYLMLKKFDSQKNSVGEAVFGPNILTLKTDVKVDYHGEAAVMFDYRRSGFTFNVGYNGWYRSKEKLNIIGDLSSDNFYGVLGTGNAANSDDTTQSTAKISSITAATIETTPVVIAKSDLSIPSATHPEAISHSIFGHIGYTWENCDYLPFVGIGGQVEFSGKKNHAFDQYAGWIKGGFTFS